MTMRARPTALDLEAARSKTIPDVLPEPGAEFLVLFCGINPGLYSAATGWHFARPGNRFWPALALSGFIPRRLAPAEQDLLPGYGLGITNLVRRPTAQASELTAAELRAGGDRLLALVRDRRPRILAIAGVTAYRTAFGHPGAVIGPQPDPLGGVRVWVLPNPSGLNALWTMPKLVAAFRDLRLRVEGCASRADRRRPLTCERPGTGPDAAGTRPGRRPTPGSRDSASRP
jgi:double-stranded uracil-DNA glycosylase